MSIRTIPELVQSLSMRRGPALSQFRGDLVEDVGGPEAALRARAVAASLDEAGLRPGDRVGILATSSVDWFLFDLGSLHAGLVTVPLFSSLQPATLAHQIRDSGLKMVLVDDDDQASQVRDVAPGVRCLSRRPGGTCESLADFESRGSQRPADPSRLPKPQDLASIVYTSGSTGRPRGVCLTHEAFAAQICGASRRFTLAAQGETAVSVLPLAHVFERMVSWFLVSAGVHLWFLDDSQRFAESLRRARPSILTVVPRLLQRVRARLEERARSTPGVRGLLARTAFAGISSRNGFTRRLAQFTVGRCVFPKVRRGLGGRLRIVVCGGAALDPALETWFGLLGVPVYQGYGMTEMGPVIATNHPASNRIGTVGSPFPGVEVRLRPDGEIEARGAGRMEGYWNASSSDPSPLDAQGWLRTGDLGRFDARGHLVLTGRVGDVAKLTTGKFVVPGPIESALSVDPALWGAVLAIEGRSSVAAILLPATNGVLTDPLVLSRIQHRIIEINRSLAPWERVRRWVFFPAVPQVRTGELTPTLKIRRQEILVRAAELLELLDRGETGHTVEESIAD